MKLIFTKTELFEVLQRLCGLVERKLFPAILANLLVSVKSDAIEFVASDLENELSLTTEHASEAEGEITIPAKKLFEICRALPDSQSIEIIKTESSIAVKSANSHFSLATFPATEFPRFGTFETKQAFAINANSLSMAMENTMFAMALQDVRYYLNGLLLEVSGDSLTTVATDGHRLSLCSVDLGEPISTPVQAIVPRKGAFEIVRCLTGETRPVEFLLSDNAIRLRVNRTVLTSKIVDGKFPDYNRVIFKSGQNVLTANTESLRQALGRNAILSNEKFKGVRVNVDKNRWHSVAHNAERERAEEFVEVNYEGEPVEMGFNISYLTDALAKIKTETVHFEFALPGGGCVIYPDSQDRLVHVVMPIRL